MTGPDKRRIQERSHETWRSAWKQEPPDQRQGNLLHHCAERRAADETRRQLEYGRERARREAEALGRAVLDHQRQEQQQRLREQMQKSMKELQETQRRNQESLSKSRDRNTTALPIGRGLPIGKGSAMAKGVDSFRDRTLGDIFARRSGSSGERVARYAENDKKPLSFGPLTSSAYSLINYAFMGSSNLPGNVFTPPPRGLWSNLPGNVFTPPPKTQPKRFI
jgi:hypothetical protein